MQWFRQRRNDGTTISVEMITAQLKIFHKEMNLTYLKASYRNLKNVMKLVHQQLAASKSPQTRKLHGIMLTNPAKFVDDDKTFT